MGGGGRLAGGLLVIVNRSGRALGVFRVRRLGASHRVLIVGLVARLSKGRNRVCLAAVRVLLAVNGSRGGVVRVLLRLGALVVDGLRWASVGGAEGLLLIVDRS